MSEVAFQSYNSLYAASTSSYGQSVAACMWGVIAKPCRSSRHSQQGFVLIIPPPYQQPQALHG